jgi:hypothetical protein
MPTRFRLVPRSGAQKGGADCNFILKQFTSQLQRECNLAHELTKS